MSSYLITGCSRGLGLALVKELALLPASEVTQIFATTRSSAPGQALQDTISCNPNRVHHVQLDVDRKASVAAAATAVEKHLGPAGLDVLINNAGILGNSLTSNIVEMTDLTSVFTTNVLGVHDVSVAFLPLLRAGRGKKILNISSTLGSLSMALTTFLVHVPTPAYDISKAALNMLTLQWSKTLASEGFCVCTVSPGNLKTELGGMGVPERAELEPKVGARGVIEIARTARAEDTGRLRNVLIPVEGLRSVCDGADIAP